MDLDSILDGALDDLEASSWQTVPSSVDSTKKHNETGVEQQQQLQKKDKQEQQQKGQTNGDEIPIIEVNTSNTAATNDGNSSSSKKSDESFVGGGLKHTAKTNKTTSSGGDMIDEAVATVNASVKEAQTHKIESGEDEMKEFFNTLFSSFNEDTTDEQLEANLKKMMGTFFNAESLKEPIQTIAEKYPRWLEANREKLEPKELENHEKQCDLYLQVWQKLDNKNNKSHKKHNNNENASMEEIMDLLTKTFAYGSLPSEVMDGMMPTELKQFADQMLRLEKELEKEEEQKNNDSNNGNSNGGSGNKSNKKKDDNNSSNAEADDAAYMKLFEQMMSGVNDPNAPDLKDMPKLSPEEMKNMQQLMKSDCLLM